MHNEIVGIIKNVRNSGSLEKSQVSNMVKAAKNAVECESNELVSQICLFHLICEFFSKNLENSQIGKS